MEKSIPTKDEQRWGVRWYSSFQELKNFKILIPDYSSWGKRALERTTYSRGLVVWDAAAQKIAVINGQISLHLLKRMKSTANWTTEGIAITEPVFRILLDDPKSGKCDDRKSHAKSQEDQVSGWIESEILWVKPEYCPALFDFLQQHEISITKLAEEEITSAKRALADAYLAILRWSNKSKTE